MKYDCNECTSDLKRVCVGIHCIHTHTRFSPGGPVKSVVDPNSSPPVFFLNIYMPKDVSRKIYIR